MARLIWTVNKPAPHRVCRPPRPDAGRTAAATRRAQGAGARSVRAASPHARGRALRAALLPGVQLQTGPGDFLPSPREDWTRPKGNPRLTGGRPGRPRGPDECRCPRRARPGLRDLFPGAGANASPMLSAHGPPGGAPFHVPRRRVVHDRQTRVLVSEKRVASSQLRPGLVPRAGRTLPRAIAHSGNESGGAARCPCPGRPGSRFAGLRRARPARRVRRRRVASARGAPPGPVAGASASPGPWRARTVRRRRTPSA